MTEIKKHITLCVVMASHNRRIQTLESLAHLDVARTRASSVEIQIVLVEDGSSDGTEAAVRANFPTVRIVRGNGDLFWSGSMRKGLELAFEEGFNYYMLLNDDTLLAPDAIQRLVSVHQGLAEPRAIVVGTVVDPESKQVTYGGRLRSSRWHPLRFEDVVIPDQDHVLPCDTINGNCVLIPACVSMEIGNLSPEFTHGGGDFDYGLRAKAEGIGLLVAPGFLGTCMRNHDREQPVPFSGGPIADLKSYATHPKKRPLRARTALFRRHGGIFWWLLVPGPYIRRVIMNVHRSWRGGGDARREPDAGDTPT